MSEAPKKVEGWDEWLEGDEPRMITFSLTPDAYRHIHQQIQFHIILEEPSILAAAMNNILAGAKSGDECLLQMPPEKKD